MGSAHFVLRRFLKGFEDYGDLYKAIKSGKKKVEYRDATHYWLIRLLTPNAIIFKDCYQDRILTFTGSDLKHDKAVFVVGHTSYPRLVADITKIVYDHETDQLVTHLANVREILTASKE